MAAKRTQADGSNVAITRDKNILTLKIDMSKFSHYSKAGNQVVGSTRGNILIEGGLKCGVNVFDMDTKNPDPAPTPTTDGE